MPRRADDEMANDRLLRHGFVWLVAVFSSTGGLQSGYGIGLATGLATSSTFQDAFPDLNPHQATPPFVLIFLLGAVVGSLPPISASIAGTFGRKRAIIGGAALGVVAGVAMAATTAGDTRWLFATRFVSGVSVGIISVAVPLYQSEVAPVHLRGRLMATFQLAITLGILLAFVTDFVLAQLPNHGPECVSFPLCHQRCRPR